MPLELDENTLACTYATLILHDDGLPITAANVSKLIEASGLEIPGFWPGLFVGAMDGQDMAKLVTAMPEGGGGGGGGGGDAPAAAAPAAGGAKKEDKKKAAPPPEEDEDMGFSLFD